MSSPTEHKTVQARILAYAQEMGWTFVSREQAEERRRGIPAPLRRKDGDRNVLAPLFLDYREKCERDLILIDSNKNKEETYA